MNLSNYSTKVDLNEARRIDTCVLGSKTDLASLEAKVVNLDVYKLITICAELSNLINVTDNDDNKHTLYDKFVTKVNAIDTMILNSS